MIQRILFVAAIVLALAFVAPAQVNVAPVQFASGFDTVNGELVLAGTQAVFVARTNMDRSFYFLRSNIDRLTDESGSIVVRLREPLQDGGNNRTQLYFRYTNPEDAQEIVSWYRNPGNLQSPNVSGGPTPGSGVTQNLMQFDVRHKRFLGDTNGQLLVTRDSIRYESTDKIEDSRNWTMRDVKEVKRDNPYELEIVPFSGNNYEFVVKGTPVSGEDFSRLQNLVISARGSSAP